MKDFMNDRAHATPMHDMEAEVAAKKMLGQMISQMILDSPTAPDYIKQSMRIVNAMSAINEMFSRTTKWLAAVNEDTDDSEKLPEILEYVTLVRQGFATFMEQYGITMV